jgi:Tol biopolymer transport system component
MRKQFIIFLILFSVFTLHAEKRAFTLADLYQIKNVTDPQISPDGKRVAFVVTEYFLEEGKSNAEIYLINIDGSDLQRMTRNDAQDTRPRWSPDGKQIMYLSTRSGNAQAWSIPLNGGEPKQLTSISNDIVTPEWSPDGNKIAFVTDVFPDCGADDKCNEEIDESMENGPLQAHMTDHLLYRHWNFWKDGKRTHIMIFDIDAKKMIDLTPGDYDSPSFSLAGATGFAFSPDGQELCLVSNRDSNEAETTNKDLWLVSTTGSAVQNITKDNKAYDGDPVYSPD